MTQQSPLTILLEQAKASLLLDLESRREELLTMQRDEMHIEVDETIKERIIPSCVRENDTKNTKKFLLYCMERPSLFDDEPTSDAVSCIAENGAPGEVNARHCVYHTLFDLLQSTLEQEFEQWYQDQKVKA